MDFYNITPAHISEHLQSLQLGERQELMKNVSTSAKTKLTKTYNKYHESTKFKKKKLQIDEEYLKFDPVLG